MVKAIVADLDDTLLKYDKTISKFTIDTLKRCSASGIKLIFATGRGTSSKKLVPDNLFDARILYNGAIAEIDNQTVYSQLIAPHIYSPFLREMSRQGLRAAAEIGGVHYANFDVSSMWERTFIISDFVGVREDAEKLYVILNNGDDEKVITQKLPPELYSHFSKDSLALIMDKKASKVNALSVVLEQMSVDFEDVIAFGDDINDKEILERCGLGIAMGNARDDVKLIADGICGNCDVDGLANYLVSRVL